MRPRLVAFCGDRGAGKDTACEALKCYGFEQASFAGPLRQVVNIALGISMHEMNDRVLKEQPLDRWPWVSPRQALIDVGTKLFRDNYPGVWLHAARNEIEDNLAPLAFSDARFHDEAAMLKSMGAVLVRIDNPNVPPTPAEKTETDWRSFDYDAVLENDCLTAAEWRVKVALWLSAYS